MAAVMVDDMVEVVVLSVILLVLVELVPVEVPDP